MLSFQTYHEVNDPTQIAFDGYITKVEKCNTPCEDYSPFISKRNVLETCNDKFTCAVNWTVPYDSNLQPIYNSTSNMIYSKMENFLFSLFTEQNYTFVTYEQSDVKAYQIFSNQLCYNDTIGTIVKIFVLKENVTNALFVYNKDETGRSVGKKCFAAAPHILLTFLFVYCDTTA